MSLLRSWSPFFGAAFVALRAFDVFVAFEFFDEAAFGVPTEAVGFFRYLFHWP